MANFELNYGYTLLEFQGDSCANCITMMPIVRSIVSKREDLCAFTVVASEETKNLIDRYGIEKIPTLVLLYNEELLGKVSGLQPEEILEYWIEDKIEEHKKTCSFK